MADSNDKWPKDKILNRNRNRVNVGSFLQQEPQLITHNCLWIAVVLSLCNK